MKIWTIHCSTCQRVLGISIKSLHKEITYCLKCAKKKLIKKDTKGGGSK